MSDAPSAWPDISASKAEREQTPTDQLFWKWTALGVGVLALAKGIRLPNSWSYTQAQLDYSEGFIRRGFFGATLGHLLQLNLYGHFAAVSTLLLLLLMAALAWLALSSRLAERTPPGELLAVYASSYSVSYLAHVNGYFDIVLALLCVGPLFIRHTGWRLAAAACATVVGILIHEQFFFAFLPVLIVSVLFGAATATSSAERLRGWAGAALLLFLGVGMILYFARHSAISTAQNDQLKHSIEGKADGTLNPEVFKGETLTPQENFGIMKLVWKRRTYVPAQVESLLMFAPTAAVLSWATFFLLRRWMPGKYRRIYVAILIATLAPLRLNLLGWDLCRWYELLSLNAFLMLLLVSRLMGGEPVHLPLRLRRACLLVMMLNMATGGGMMDQRHIRPFPFMRSQNAAAITTTAAVSAARGNSLGG